MAGLQRICKMLGGITVTSKNGKTIKYVYDYVAEKPVDEKNMPFGSARHAASERAKYLQNLPSNALQCVARGCDGCDVCKQYAQRCR